MTEYVECPRCGVNVMAKGRLRTLAFHFDEEGMGGRECQAGERPYQEVLDELARRRHIEIAAWVVVEVVCAVLLVTLYLLIGQGWQTFVVSSTGLVGALRLLHLRRK